MTSNFANGITNIPPGHPLYNTQFLEIPYGRRWSTWFDDFTKYTAADWVITTVEAGGGSATEALADADGGVLVITNDVADDDADWLQSVAELFTFTPGKKLYFEARFKVNEVIQSEIVMGLQVRDTSPLDAGDGVWFQSDDGDALLDFKSGLASSVSSSTGVYTLVADTYVAVAFAYNGIDEIAAYAGSTPTTMTRVATQGITTLPTTELTVSFGCKAGEVTNAKILSVDYILVAKEVD